MRSGSSRAALMAGAAFGVLTITIGEATAGGFAVREQSVYGQGASFAGIAAGGALSGMFWNPAVMTQFGGLTFEAGLSGILPNASQSPGLGTFPPFLLLGGVDNSADTALVPMSYTSWQVTPNVWLGLSVNAPFGLTVSFPNAWAGRLYAGDSSLKSYNATPSVAVKINEWLSLGAGVQIMYSTAKLRTGLPFGLGFAADLSGESWSYGVTAGATITPGPYTQIGIGWRSSLNLDIDDGDLTTITPFGSLAIPAATKVKLPDIVSLGIRHMVTPNVTLLGTVEWTNWSRIGTSNVTSSGVLVTTLPFQYDDGWFFSVGAEYAVNPGFLIRAGFGYEISPITDGVRTPRLPDNDRYWASLGMSFKPVPNLIFDFAYTHIFVKDTPIDISATSGNPWFNPLIPLPYVGTVNSSVDIVSLAVRYQFAPPPPAPPLITKG